jgi:hypothetical protein
MLSRYDLTELQNTEFVEASILNIAICFQKTQNHRNTILASTYYRNTAASKWRARGKVNQHPIDSHNFVYAN